MFSYISAINTSITNTAYTAIKKQLKMIINDKSINSSKYQITETDTSIQERQIYFMLMTLTLLRLTNVRMVASQILARLLIIYNKKYYSKHPHTRQRVLQIS